VCGECNTHGRDDKYVKHLSRKTRNGGTAPSGPGPPQYWGFTIALRHSTFGRTPLDEWPARRRDLYLTTHNTHKKHTSMLPAGFEPAIPASVRPQTHPLDRVATGISWPWYIRGWN